MTPLDLRLDAGRLSVASAGAAQVILRGVTLGVSGSVEGRAFRWFVPTLTQETETFTARDGDLGLRVELRGERRGPTLVLHATLHNEGSHPIQIEEFAPLCVDESGEATVGAGLDAWAVFRNGYQSWSGTRAWALDEVDRDPLWSFLRLSTTDFRHPSAGRAGVVRSDLFTVIKNRRSGEALCLGFLDARRAFGTVTVRAPEQRFDALAASCDYDGTVLAPGATWHAEPLWIGVDFDEQAVLAAYGSALGATMHARCPARVPAGWCSWYYYFTRVTEQDVLANLEQLARLRSSVPCDYVQVDDGYQRAIGDWLEPNDKFPHGMPWLAERIRAAGFEAGIWLAPFIARKESQLLRAHPDWFVRTSTSRLRSAIWNPLWGYWGYAYALDTTHPAALDWLQQLAHTLVHEWGYRILKLDFLFAAALPGVRYDRGATRAVALRRGLEAIRAGAGDEAFLLGCGCPLGPAVGIVDGMRIGADVAPFWSLWFTRTVMRDLHGVATKHAVRNTLTRSFMHRRLWLNDPDCLMVRAQQTRLTAAEVRALATAIAVTDGMFVVSDRLDRLPAEQLALLERARQLTGGQPTLVDLFDRDMPELLVARRRHDTLVAAFNFGDARIPRRVDLAALGLRANRVTEWWTGAPLAVRDGVADLGVLEPHDARVLILPTSNETVPS